jgi:hypothetical protein
MASPKEYAYYLEGNKVGIVERDTAFDNDPNSKDYGPGTHRSVWKSPLSDVTDALEVKYTYAPIYRIILPTNTDDVNVYYGGTNGKLRLGDLSSPYKEFSTLFDVGDYIVLTSGGKFNGLHKVTAFESSTGTDNVIVTDTDYSLNQIPVTFEEVTKLYYKISALQDESFELDLPLYLQKALVYYVKAKLAEDVAQIELKEYMMKEFRRMLEKYENSRISGLRIISSGANAIR